MSDIINLRQARKARKRADNETSAAANRVKHGRSKADKDAAAAAKTKLDAVVDGARRDRTVLSSGIGSEAQPEQIPDPVTRIFGSDEPC